MIVLWPLEDITDKALIGLGVEQAPGLGQWDEAEIPKEGDEIFPEPLAIGFIPARDRAMGVAPLSVPTTPKVGFIGRLLRRWRR